MPSVPFVSFKIASSGSRHVVRLFNCQKLELDLIHTHTEFGAGILGKMVGKK